MKRLIVLSISLLFLAFSCSKEDEMVTKLMEVSFSAHGNPDILPVQCLPEDFGLVFLDGGGWISGNATHIGEVNKELSPYTVDSCSFGPKPGQITEYVSGIITSSTTNGDSFYNYGQIVVTFEDGLLEGQITIDDGTGKFENASGLVLVSGLVDFNAEAVSWTGQGNVTFKK